MNTQEKRESIRKTRRMIKKRKRAEWKTVLVIAAVSAFVITAGYAQSKTDEISVNSRDSLKSAERTEIVTVGADRHIEEAIRRGTVALAAAAEPQEVIESPYIEESSDDVDAGTDIGERAGIDEDIAESGGDAGSSGGIIDGMNYSRRIDMTATAYSTAPEENGGYSVSAMGSPLGYGIVAVDPSVIPLGSTVYVTSDDGSWSYGVASAEDTGGAIKGNRIDLCYDTTGDVSWFGRRGCVVYVLK